MSNKLARKPEDKIPDTQVTSVEALWEAISTLFRTVREVCSVLKTKKLPPYYLIVIDFMSSRVEQLSALLRLLTDQTQEHELRAELNQDCVRYSRDYASLTRPAPSQEPQKPLKT